MPWPTKKLGDCLIQFDRGISWSRKDEGGTIAVLRIPNIQEGQINLDDLKYISAKNGNGELDKNDIVMVASNGNPDLVGRSALVTEKEKGMRFASFLIRLRFNNTKLLSQYVHLFLLMPTFKRELRRKIATTSGIYNLKKEHVERIEIPVPPLAIQTQIIERLDKIAEAQKLNDGLIQKIDELFQSLLHKELNPAGKGWEVKKLNEVLEINYGKGLDKSKRIDSGKFLAYGSNGPVYRTNESLINGEIIVIGRKGTAGALYFVSKPCWPIDTTFFAKPKNKTSLKFIYYLLQTKSLPRLAIVTGVPGINRTTLANINIQLPPLEIQKQIVAKLSAVQGYKGRLLEQKAKLKELFESALHNAFRGSPR